MALQGKIIKLQNGTPGFEHSFPHYEKPEMTRQVWALETWGTSGYSCSQLEDAFDKPATITDGQVSCYLGNGNYLRGNLKDGGSTKAIITETLSVAKPKSRTELRWYNGAWQKYLASKGWVTA